MMKKFKYSEGLPGGSNEIKVNGTYSVNGKDINALLQSNIAKDALYNSTDGFNPIEADLYSKVIMNRNKGVGFVDRAFALGENPGTPLFNLPDDEQFGSYMSHKMAHGTDDAGQSWLYPTVLNEADEAIKVPNQYADYISRDGYKKATGMMRNYGGSTLDEYNPGGPIKKETIRNDKIENKPGWFKRNLLGHKQGTKDAISDAEQQTELNNQKRVVNQSLDRGFGTIHKGEVYSQADLERMYPGKAHRPEYQALLNRDVRLVTNPSDFKDEATALANANRATNRYEGEEGTLGSIPVRFDENGKAIGYVDSGLRGGYDSRGRERQNVINFPATPQLIQEMAAIREGKTEDRLGFLNEVTVQGPERPAYLPENISREQVKQKNDLISAYNLDPNNDSDVEKAWMQVLYPDRPQMVTPRSNSGVDPNQPFMGTFTQQQPQVEMNVDEAAKIVTQRLKDSGQAVFEQGKTDEELEAERDNVSIGAKIRDYITNAPLMLKEGTDIYNRTGGLPLYSFDKKMVQENREEEWNQQKLNIMNEGMGSSAVGDFFQRANSTINPFLHASNLSGSIIDNEFGYGTTDGRYIAPGQSTSRVLGDALDLGLSTATIGTGGGLFTNAVKYETGALGQGLKQTFGRNPNVVSSGANLLNRAKGLTKSFYHGNKAYYMPQLAKDLFSFGSSGDSGYSSGDVSDFSTKLINVANPFKAIPGGGYVANELAKSGKDLYKGFVSGAKALDFDSDTQTQDALKSMSYFGSTIHKPLKTEIKILGKFKEPIDKYVVEPGKEFVSSLFNPIGPGETMPMTDQEKRWELGEKYEQVQAGNIGAAKNIETDAGTSSLMYGGTNNTYQEQRQKMIQIVDSPMYMQTLKKQFPKYNQDQLLELRTNRLNALLMG